MKRILLAVTCQFALAAPALAAHNNPWAEADDVLIGAMHEVNLTQSSDTPGEDEMKGKLERNVPDHAGGGLAGAAPQDGSGHRGGRAD